MKKICEFFLGAYIIFSSMPAFSTDKYDILPDLPEPLAAAQASSITNTNSPGIVTQSIGTEPNIMTIIYSLVVVILLIYTIAIIYDKLNKMGFKLFKNNYRENSDSIVSVISTTPLGSNKTLHIVELNGKRMLLGASTNGIHLIKDLGSYPPKEINDMEYSKIEIPNIRIPKIEIPKIEFPNIGFTKAFKTSLDEHKTNNNIDLNTNNSTETKENNSFEISDIYEESPDGIIDKLFTISEDKSNPENKTEEKESIKEEDLHVVDPDEYTLYKKYI